ncbi:hypothetical protein [Escherichia coli]|uniref:hypothetical protein n=1 Tax=Escherichia coli TaxID=562 RepID=UPI00301CB0CB
MIWQPEFTDKTLSRKPGAVHMCAAIADTTTLKTHLESVVKTSLSKLIKNAKATKKANLFIHI